MRDSQNIWAKGYIEKEEVQTKSKSITHTHTHTKKDEKFKEIPKINPQPRSWKGNLKQTHHPKQSNEEIET